VRLDQGWDGLEMWYVMLYIAFLVWIYVLATNVSL
jgi:hypothetical protein